MRAPEVREVDSEVVMCDGGNDALGHPAVYLNLGPDRQIDCPYCGRRFILKQGVEPAAH